MDTLKKHLPVSGSDGLHELSKIAQRFEDKIYNAATSQVHSLCIVQPPLSLMVTHATTLYCSIAYSLL
jgi:hypothetical protein